MTPIRKMELALSAAKTFRTMLSRCGPRPAQMAALERLVTSLEDELAGMRYRAAHPEDFVREL